MTGIFDFLLSGTDCLLFFDYTRETCTITSTLEFVLLRNATTARNSS